MGFELVACDNGLGCDLASDRCVQPCGGVGQPCCDGPETRAPKWTVDGRGYSPNFWNMKEMCAAGACDRATHRCFACGTKGGQPCCPPDAAQATARCMGDHLECDYSLGVWTGGTCFDCGFAGKPPCYWGCDTGLGIRNGLCAVCGGDFQLPCDPNQCPHPPCKGGCDNGLETAQGVCRHCGAAGQIPCDRGCNAGLGLKGGLCTPCGNDGQLPCDSGCNAGLHMAGGVCRYCGGYYQVPCDTGCNPPYKPAGGRCQNCGKAGQIPCDQGGCDPGLVVQNGKCSASAPPPPPPPSGCAGMFEPCVPDHMQGTHCCHGGATELLCYWGGAGNICHPCIPHGQECTRTQTCCSWGDVCKLDQFSQKEVCDIPG